jgi:ACR3 family arsenite transporter
MGQQCIMVFAFAPIAALLLGVTDIVVPWQTLLLSVILYVVIPLAAGYMGTSKNSPVLLK